MNQRSDYLGEPMAEERRTGERRSADRRRPGRPSLVEGQVSEPVSVRFAADMYDCVYVVASRCGISVPELVRLAVKRLLDDERGAMVRLK